MPQTAKAPSDPQTEDERTLFAYKAHLLELRVSRGISYKEMEAAGFFSKEIFRRVVADRTPPRREHVQAYLQALGVAGEELQAELAAYTSVRAPKPFRLEGGAEPPDLACSLRTGRPVRVREVSWELAGVHRPVPEMARLPDGQVPYVARTLEPVLRSQLRTALTRSGPTMLVLAGESTAGKTRLAFEGLKQACPDAWWIAPVTGRDAQAALVQLASTDAGPLPEREPVIVWLDDLERFIGPDGDGPSRWHFEALKAGSRTVIVLATRGGRTQGRVPGSPAQVSLLEEFAGACPSPLTLRRRLDDDERTAAAGVMPDVAARLDDGLGSLAVARTRLQARYDYAPDTGESGERSGRALVDALLLLRGALGPLPTGEDVVKAAHRAMRRGRDLHGPWSPQEWEAATAWASHASVPGHPLARWDERRECWEASDVISYTRGDEIADAHVLLDEALETWAGDDARRALHVATTAHDRFPDALPGSLAGALERWYGRAEGAPGLAAHVWGGLARLREQVGDVDTAGALYARAAAGTETPGAVLVNHALFLEQHGSAALAREAHWRAVEETRWVGALSNFGAFLTDHGESAAALEVLELARTAAPGHPATLLNLARLAEKAGDHARAAALIHDCIERNGATAEAMSRLLLAACSAGMVSRADARAALDAETRRVDATAAVTMRYATFLADDGDTAAAAAVVRELLLLEPTRADLQGALARVLESSDPRAALDAYEAAAAHDASWVRTYVLKLDQLGRSEDADAYVVQALSAGRIAQHEALVAQALLAEGRGDLAAAVQAAEEARRSKPDDVRVGRSLARLCMTAGDAERADELWEELSHHYPADADDLGNYALLLAARGRHAEALNTFGRALDCDPGHPNNLANLSVLLYALDGDAPAALQWIAVARRREPEHPFATSVEAWLRFVSGETDTGRTMFAERLLADPAQAVAHAASIAGRSREEHVDACHQLFDRVIARQCDVREDAFVEYARLARSGALPFEVQQLHRAAVARGWRQQSR